MERLFEMVIIKELFHDSLIQCKKTITVTVIRGTVMLLIAVRCV